MQHSAIQHRLPLLLLLLLWLPGEQHIKQHGTTSWQWYLRQEFNTPNDQTDSGSMTRGGCTTHQA
jgi:hypothetical protein